MLSINVSNICKNYAGENALRGLTFSIGQGQLYGLIGADGAGKTTLLRILVTLISADSGSASVMGFDVAKDLQKIRSEIGYMPQKFSLYQDLTVRENMMFFADVYGVKTKERKERMNRLLDFSRLRNFQSRRAANLSGGMKQKLALSCALVHTPKLLVLDEPTTGVDPVSRKEFWDILKELRKQGITIIVSTPYMDEATMCDSLMIMHKGEILRTGSPSELIDSYPFDIYKIENEEFTINCPQDTKVPQGIIMMYPSGGAIHVVVQKEIQTSEELFGRVKNLFGAAVMVDKIKPGIEDLFFLLVSEKDTNKSVA